MSSTTTTLKPTPSSACGSTLFEIPTNDAACAMPYSTTATSLLTSCCGDDALIVSYASDCGVYCLAQDQSVDELTQCLYARGAAWQDVFCNAPMNATATATDNARPTASGASVVASGGETRSTDTADDNTDGGDGGDDDGNRDDDRGAAGVGRGVSAWGAVVVGLLLSSTVFGAILV